MSALVETSVLLVTLAAVVAGGSTLLATRQLQLSVAVFVDLLLAAGLLRLAVAPELERLAAAGAILAIRKLVGVRWRFGERTRWRVPRASH